MICSKNNVWNLDSTHIGSIYVSRLFLLYNLFLIPAKAFSKNCWSAAAARLLVIKLICHKNPLYLLPTVHVPSAQVVCTEFLVSKVLERKHFHTNIYVLNKSWNNGTDKGRGSKTKKICEENCEEYLRPKENTKDWWTQRIARRWHCESYKDTEVAMVRYIRRRGE